MKILNKRWISTLACMVILMQSTLASATLISDYNLTFSDVDDVIVGGTFDVEVSLDSPLITDLFAFGFDINNSLNNVTLVGFTVAEYNGIEPIVFDEFDVGGFVTGFPFDNLLATLHFTADNVGVESVSFFSDVDPFAGSGALFWDESLDGSIGGVFDVTVVAQQIDVPEPSSVFILLIAVAALVMQRKSRSN